MRKTLLTLGVSLFMQLGFAQKKYNIVFIAVDDLKPMLNCYGEKYMHTPNFDRLAKMGVSFTNAQVQQAVCGPSRTSVMTGTYPDHNKDWDLETNFRISAPELISMPEYLISQGYITTVSGKKVYHNGNVSEGHDGKSWSIPYKLADDFDPKYGNPAARLYHNDSLNVLAKKYEAEAIGKGIKDHEGIDWYIFKKIMVSTEAADVSDEGYEDGIYAKEAVNRLAELAKQDKPFFYGIGFSRPHLPFNAPKKYWDLYKRNEVPLAKFQDLVPGTPKFVYHTFGELRAYNDIDDNYSLSNKIPEDKQRELVHGYMASVSYVDAQLGKILDAIEKNNLSKNTIIILWGDHGYHLGDHAMWNKHSNFEQATRIPFMFAGPGIDKNKMVKNPVELVDAFPTLFDLCGIKIPQQTDGISVKNLLDNSPKTTVKKDFAMSQYPREGNRMGYSIRTERYRLTEWYKNGYNTNKEYDAKNLEFTEFYDYQADPLETKNLANDKKYEKNVKDLHQKLVQHLNKIHNKIK